VGWRKQNRRIREIAIQIVVVAGGWRALQGWLAWLLGVCACGTAALGRELCSPG
jgi:hypothetical protein